MKAFQPSDALSMFGFFLTLAGLLGSFFYIHLGDWYRQVLALRVKWEINKLGDDPYLKAGRRECRYEAEQIASGVMATLITSIVVTLFLLLIAVLAALLWLAEPDKSGEWMYIAIAGVGFLAIYLTMTSFFVIAGYSMAFKVRGEVRKAQAEKIL